MLMLMLVAVPVLMGAFMLMPVGVVGFLEG
jgi:hypothetical protein